MTTPFDQLFGLKSLNGMVLAFAQESALNTRFRDLFSRGRTLQTAGAGSDTVEWDEVQLHRHLAPVVGHDAPSPTLEHTTKINRRSAVAHIKLSKKIPARKLYGERGPGTMQANAEGVVDTELRDLTKVIGNTIEYMAVNTLNGTLTVNSTNIPGTQTPFTITYSPNTATAAATWATDSTNINTDLLAFKQDFMQTSGLMAGQVITSGTVLEHITSNDNIRELLRQEMGPIIAQSGTNLFGALFEGFRLGNLDWEINEAGYVPQGGSFTNFIPATDDLFMLPSNDQLPDVLGMALGTGFVPTRSLGPAASAAGLIRPAPSAGWYSYAVDCVDPVGVEIYVGWVGLPVLLYPNGVLVADVVP